MRVLIAHRVQPLILFVQPWLSVPVLSEDVRHGPVCMVAEARRDCLLVVVTEVKSATLKVPAKRSKQHTRLIVASTPPPPRLFLSIVACHLLHHILLLLNTIGHVAIDIDIAIAITRITHTICPSNSHSFLSTNKRHRSFNAYNIQSSNASSTYTQQPSISQHTLQQHTSTQRPRRSKQQGTRGK